MKNIIKKSNDSLNTANDKKDNNRVAVAVIHRQMPIKFTLKTNNTF